MFEVNFLLFAPKIQNHAAYTSFFAGSLITGVWLFKISMGRQFSMTIFVGIQMESQGSPLFNYKECLPQVSTYKCTTGPNHKVNIHTILKAIFLLTVTSSMTSSFHPLVALVQEPSKNVAAAESMCTRESYNFLVVETLEEEG